MNNTEIESEELQEKKFLEDLDKGIKEIQERTEKRIEERRGYINKQNYYPNKNYQIYSILSNNHCLNKDCEYHTEKTISCGLKKCPICGRRTTAWEFISFYFDYDSIY